MQFDTVSDHARLVALQAVIDRWLAELGERMDVVAPAVTAWSPLKHVAHVALANELVLRNIKSLVSGQGALVVQGGEPVKGALRLLETGLIERGRAQSPRMVRPPEAVDRALLREWLDDGRHELQALDPLVIRAGDLKVPHQLLGPLDAPQWVRFGVVHTRHHLAIAGEALAAQGADPAALALPAITGPTERAGRCSS